MAEPEFSDALSYLETALETGLRSFAKWFATSWAISREEWERDLGDLPTGDYFDGYKAGVESVSGALDMFLDEHPYG